MVQATPVVQADLYLSVESFDTVEGDNVLLVNSTNCNDAIPKDTRVLLVKRDSCPSLGELKILANYPNLERIGFGENTMASCVIFSLIGPCHSCSSL